LRLPLDVGELIAGWPGALSGQAQARAGIDAPNPRRQAL
jgi:hypothetical protein